MNHPTDKIELIIMGGTFLEYSEDYKYNFIKRCYDALNNESSKTLEKAKKINELAKHRCVALCIETRPDTCSKKEIKRILDFGCTRVELGVQCLDNKILKKINRGHFLKEIIESTKKLKNAGFKIGYHMMLGLPGSNTKKDFETFKILFQNKNFKPDQLKIYPCQVIKGAELENLYKQKKYKPYTQKQNQDLIIKIMKIIPNYCRVMRIMREIPPDYLTAGILRIDLRKDIDEELKKTKTKVQEIRFREIGFALRDKLKNEKINKKLRLKITKYQASDGDEYFLEIINKNNILFGLCRLRIFKNKNNQYESFVRELHVYGQSLSLNKVKLKLKKSQVFSAQHKGLGKKLLKEAEKITFKKNIKELKIISGIGVREYYKKLGYKLDKNQVYMIKKLK
jgi:elongator complex protein 3